MTVRELIDRLQALSDEEKDMLAVVAGDEEGNSFASVYDVVPGWYDQRDREWTDLIYDIEDEDELERSRTTAECNSVCLWP